MNRLRIIAAATFIALVSALAVRAATPPDAAVPPAPAAIVIQNATILTVSHGTIEHGSIPVSYTHLDVYKRQVFSMCEWGTSKPWLWAKDVGNLWRTTGDITDCWDCKTDSSVGFVRILDLQDGLETYAGPGHWNDPDMLEVGNLSLIHI